MRSSWSALRLFVVCIGTSDLVHTLWLHWMHVYNPPLLALAHTSGTRRGPPTATAYLTALYFIGLAVAFNSTIRHLLAHHLRPVEWTSPPSVPQPDAHGAVSRAMRTTDTLEPHDSVRTTPAASSQSAELVTDLLERATSTNQRMEALQQELDHERAARQLAAAQLVEMYGASARAAEYTQRRIHELELSLQESERVRVLEKTEHERLLEKSERARCERQSELSDWAATRSAKYGALTMRTPLLPPAKPPTTPRNPAACHASRGSPREEYGHDEAACARTPIFPMASEHPSADASHLLCTSDASADSVAGRRPLRKPSQYAANDMPLPICASRTVSRPPRQLRRPPPQRVHATRHHPSPVRHLSPEAFSPPAPRRLRRPVPEQLALSKTE